MSRTKNTNESGSKNPATKYLNWKSSAKAFTFWNKQAEKEEVVDPSSLSFVVLDQLNTVKGFDEKAMSGLWSNEVRSIGKDELSVRNKDGIVVTGLYKDIKGKHDGKFTKSVYVLGKIGDGDHELMNLQFSGAALSSWFTFCEATGNVETDIAISATKVAEGKKGAVTYYYPEFSVVASAISPATSEKANEADETLQAYLTTYFGGGEPETAEPEESAPAEEESWDSAPF